MLISPQNAHKSMSCDLLLKLLRSVCWDFYCEMRKAFVIIATSSDFPNFWVVIHDLPLFFLFLLHVSYSIILLSLRFPFTFFSVLSEAHHFWIQFQTFNFLFAPRCLLFFCILHWDSKFQSFSPPVIFQFFHFQGLAS